MTRPDPTALAAELRVWIRDVREDAEVAERGQIVRYQAKALRHLESDLLRAVLALDRAAAAEALAEAYCALQDWAGGFESDDKLNGLHADTDAAESAYRAARAQEGE